MHILIFINSKIPVRNYGGTQRVMWYLGKELSQMRHRVTFMAARGSRSEFADIIEYNPSLSIEKQIPESVDVVHFNDIAPDVSFLKPYIVTYHGNRLPGEIDKNAVFVSRNHAKRFGCSSFVYNGLYWDDYAGDIQGNRSAFHFLGKAAWSVKNVRGAISVVTKLPGAELNVLGGSRLNIKMGFRFTMSSRVHFKGEVGGAEKLEWLYRSKGLIFPVIWDEPFGLAVIESLYCGAPVFATPYGSLQELVIPEVGFLTRSKREMIAHIRDYSGDYSPNICREYASDVFNSRKMACDYIKKYEIVMNGDVLNPTCPKPIEPFNRYKFV